jgi:glycosyltransferase involved in cell wall biosynthesis
MVTTFYPPYHFGGDATFVQSLARALVRNGHHVEVVHCEDAFRIQSRHPSHDLGHDDGVVVHRLRSRFGMLSPLITQQTGVPGLKAAPLRRILDRPFDVVNFHNISLVGGPGILTMSRAPVTLYTVHEHWLMCPTHILWKNRRRACDRRECLTCSIRSGIPPQLWRYSGLVTRGLARVDALLAPSAFTARQHEGLASNVPIHVLPTFSDLDPEPLAPAVDSERPRFVFVGRVTASKGIASLLEEWASLASFDIDVVGDGDLRAELERRYRGCAHIRFLGQLPQRTLARLYQGATALVLPSLAPEVFPLTILEAMACGTPAIVHDAGGSREAIDRTGGGMVYRTREGLRDALMALAQDRNLRKAMGERARVGFEQFYTRERYLSRYLDLIADLDRRKEAGSAR